MSSPVFCYVVTIKCYLCSWENGPKQILKYVSLSNFNIFPKSFSFLDKELLAYFLR